MTGSEAPRAATAGHRNRLRARLLKGGGDALADYELMELLLFHALPRRDAKPMAKELVGKFGGFARAIAAEPARIREVGGAGDAVVAALKTVEAAMLRALRERMEEKPALANWQAVLDYCKAAMQHNAIEIFRVIYLDRKNRVIADEAQQSGTVDSAPVYPREVVRRALDLGAVSVILAHNHPSGDPTPSRQDIAVTKQVIEAAQPLGIEVHDHLVIGRDGHASFKEMHLI